MLVLTRKSGQTIRIGDVVIRIVRVKGAAVRIGVQAPRTTKVLRGELRDKDKAA
jgi:carbon storage regulator